MRTQKFAIIATLLLTGMWSMAQGQNDRETTISSDSGEYRRSPFQVTFLFPPFSTNGFDNINFVSNLSLNLFVGASGGTDGVELGGFINVDRYFVNGFQAAGFGNTVGSNVDGLQLAGFYNVAGGDVRYVQGAGFTNVTGGNQFGLQGAGFGNVVGKDMFGVQGSGFFNVAGGKTTGVQGAGFINVAGDTVKGLQGAGFMNIARGFDDGIQAAGFANVAVEGKVNVQASGFINRADEVEGIQAAGFANVAGYVKGVQAAGFINVCDSIDGVPIGFINIVKHGGLRQLEFSASDARYFALTYKMGVDKLYTFYTLGKAMSPSSRWLYGIGLGSRWELMENSAISIEASTMSELYIGDSRASWFFYQPRYNSLNQLSVSYSYELGNFAEAFVGPTFNVAIGNTYSYNDPYSIPWESLAPRWTFFDRTYGNSLETNVAIWIGLKGGIRF